MRIPDLAVCLPEGADSTGVSLPLPWKFLGDDAIAMPGPFNAMPPKGRRHALVQLELRDGAVEDKAADSQNTELSQEEEAEATVPILKDLTHYILTFYGNLYPFKEGFEAKCIRGAFITTSYAEADYARYLECKLDEVSKTQILMVLEDILGSMPLYFINMVAEDDPMATWLRELPSIF